jgi:cytochrome c oxidase subunit 4
MTNTSHTIPSAEPHAADEGHGGIGKYIAVFVALCLLTSASFFTYSSYWPFHATPSIGWAFMMAVSCTKAMLVILFFMHLLWEANWKYVLTVPALFMSIFLICMLIPDVGLRQRNYSEERRSFAAEVMPPMTHADHGDHDVEHAAEHPSNDEGLH